MLTIGELAPDFTLQSDDNRKISLHNFRGRKVVLYFYPKADTPGCTRQACALRDVYPQLEDRTITVIGISPDLPAALARFRKKHDLPFVLLSDPDHEVAVSYGAWGEQSFMGKKYQGIIRSHFIIDEEGRLIDEELKVKPERTADLSLKLIPTT